MSDCRYVLNRAALYAALDPEPIRHGTSGGYSMHIRRGTAPCDECRAARRVYDRSRGYQQEAAG